MLKKIVFTVGFLVISNAVFAAPWIKNGTFERIEVQAGKRRMHGHEDATNTPKYWRVDGLAPRYELDQSVRRSGGNSLKVRFQSDFNKEGYSGAIQNFDASALAGKRVVLSGYFRRNSVASKVGLWLLAADRSGKKLGYANSYDQPLATDGWSAHRIEFDVPPNAGQLKLGVAIYEGDGDMWVDDVQLSVVNVR
jgi:hypothetical protein